MDMSRLDRLVSTGLKAPSLNKDTLALVYTPGVGDVCLHIQSHPESINTHTNRLNSVAIISNGSGCGLPALATLPYLEWIAIQMKYFGGLDAYPFVVGAGGGLEEVVADLGNSMAAIVSIDRGLPGKCPDVVFASLLNYSKDTQTSFLDAEQLAYAVKERLSSMTFGVLDSESIRRAKKPRI
jgi:malic enzyme